MEIFISIVVVDNGMILEFKIFLVKLYVLFTKLVIKSSCKLVLKKVIESVHKYYLLFDLLKREKYINFENNTLFTGILIIKLV